MDTIIIRDLAVEYHVGVTDAERATPQRLLISVELAHDFNRAALSEDLADTIDYFAVSQRLLRFGEGRSWKLIEKLAVDIARLTCEEFKAARSSVEVKKFAIPEARYAAVRVTRTNC